MQLSIPHQFTKAAAVARVKEALAKARSELNGKATIDEERWEGDVLHFAVSGQGQHLSGTFEVKETEFDLNVKLPLMLRMFEGKIKQAIQEQAAGLLGK